MRQPTNTLILTNLPYSILSNPQKLLKTLQGYLIEVIILLKFQRILIICESVAISQYINNIISEKFPDFTISYSLYDNPFNMTTQDKTIINNQVDFSETQYLELPSDKASRRFLISPPLSPPAGWDHWDKVESGPNKQTIYSFEELSHLLWQRLGTQGEEEEEEEKEGEEIVKKVKGGEKVDIRKQPELLFKDIEHVGIPAIILDSIEGDIEDINIPKTSLPPTNSYIDL